MNKSQRPPLHIPWDDVLACPLYQWELGTRLPLWKRGVVPAWLSLSVGGALLIAVVWAPLSGARQVVLELALFACAIGMIALWDMRAHARFRALLSSGLIRDLYLAGIKPLIILKSFSYAQFEVSRKVHRPLYAALLIVVADMYLGFDQRGFLFVVILCFWIVSLLRHHHRYDVDVQRRLNDFEVTLLARKDSHHQARRPVLPLLFVVGIVYFGSSRLVFLAWLLFIAGAFVYLVMFTKRDMVKKMTNQELDDYLDAFMREEQPDPKDYCIAFFAD